MSLSLSLATRGLVNGQPAEIVSLGLNYEEEGQAVVAPPVLTVIRGSGGGGGGGVGITWYTPPKPLSREEVKEIYGALGDKNRKKAARRLATPKNRRQPAQPKPKIYIPPRSKHKFDVDLNTGRPIVEDKPVFISLGSTNKQAKMPTILVVLLASAAGLILGWMLYHLLDKK